RLTALGPRAWLTGVAPGCIFERARNRRQPGDLTMDFGRARSSFFAPFGSACAFFIRAPAAATRFLSRSGCDCARGLRQSGVALVFRLPSTYPFIPASPGLGPCWANLYRA